VTKLTILETWIRGTCVASNGSTRILRVEEGTINKFGAGRIDAGALRLPATTDRVRVIEALDGQLVTNEVHASAILEDGALRSDPSTDVLKIVVVNRYTDAKPAVAFIRNIGLTHGALASSVAHDSHNVVAVGVDDADIAAAVNAVIDARGGVSVHADGRTDVLPLPVAGLMSAADGYEVAAAYAALDGRVKRELGTGLRAPFMTLSFMALLVIPALKLSDRGLFDGSAFAFVDVRLDG